MSIPVALARDTVLQASARTCHLAAVRARDGHRLPCPKGSGWDDLIRCLGRPVVSVTVYETLLCIAWGDAAGWLPRFIGAFGFSWAVGRRRARSGLRSRFRLRAASVAVENLARRTD